MFLIPLGVLKSRFLLQTLFMNRNKKYSLVLCTGNSLPERFTNIMLIFNRGKGHETPCML